MTVYGIELVVNYLLILLNPEELSLIQEISIGMIYFKTSWYEIKKW